MANKNSGDFIAIIAIFVGVIIAIVLLASISDSIFDQTNTFTVTNESVVVAAINVSVGTTGRDLVGTGSIGNSTQASIERYGLSLSDTVLISGAKTISIVANDSATAQIGDTVNVSYTYNPDGYLADGGARSVASLIVVFGAIAAFMYVIIVLIGSGSFRELMGKNRRRD